MNRRMTERNIIEMVKNGELTAQEGADLYLQLRSSRIDDRLSSNPSAIETMYYHPLWERAELNDDTSQESLTNVLVFGRSLNIVDSLTSHIQEGTAYRPVLVLPGQCYRQIDQRTFEILPSSQDNYHLLLNDLQKNDLMPRKILHMWSSDVSHSMIDTLESQLSQSIYSICWLSQAIMAHRPQKAIGLIYVYYSSPEPPVVRPQYAAVDGFLRTLAQEYPLIQGKTVEMVGELDLPGREESDPASWIHLVRELRAGLAGPAQVRYIKGERWARVFRPIERKRQDGADTSGFIKENGVYLISGGMGGLGRVLSQYLAKNYRAKLVLIGRSALDDERKEQIAAIERSGGEAIYIKADISVQTEAESVVIQAKEKFSAINGIIHAAGVIKDSFIINKTAGEIKEVLAPKIQGTIWLDWATRRESLDFFLIFSSASAVFGQIGQSDYAYANSFAHHYSQWRHESGGSGKSMALDWPRWLEGGMKIPREAEEELARTLGVYPLASAIGLSAFEDALRLPAPQLLVLNGDRPKIEKALANLGGRSAAVEKVPKPVGDHAQLQAKAETYLKNLLAKELKLSADKICVKEALEAYGIDSIVITRLNRALDQDFTGLSKTLFYEYRTISELARYFATERAAQLIKVKEPDETRRLVQPPPARTEPRGRYIGPAVLGKPAVSKPDDGEVAIIGLSGRFPMAKNIEEFWANLTAGRDCIQEIPPERWDYHQDYDPDRSKKGKSYSKWGGFVADFDKFDPLFFNISPKEAQYMDPQERLFLETVWEAMEDSGYTRQSMEKYRVGVYVGVMYGHYQILGVEESLRGKAVATSSSYASIANRVSYVFNFRGPCMALDTMCSSSLTAIHLACQSLQKGESEMAIAGGVNLSIHPAKYLFLSQGQFVSSDGRCRSFGRGGDGYVPGEGVGAVILKPLSKAIQDGDQIYAVIKRTSINHGGRTNGYTVPNPQAQAALIAETLAMAGIRPRTISYLEAHGTGTSLGDPIEITGLVKAFAESTKDRQFCAIGSVKSNIGHLESAAGIAGVIKVLLQMKHGRIVPSIHAEVLNHNIAFEDTPFYLQTELEPWERPEIIEDGSRKIYPRRAGISSFGAGGSNAHVILEEYQNSLPSQRRENGEEQLILLSAWDEERLRAYAARLLAFVEKALQGEADREGPTVSLSELAYMLQTGREAMGQRVAFIAASLEELRAGLSQYVRGSAGGAINVYRGNSRARKIAGESLMEEEDAGELLRSLAKRRDLHKLARFWVAGMDFDWRLLYEGAPPAKRSVPTYPFKRESYWITDLSSGRPAVSREHLPERLHPFLHRNTSTLREQKFSSRFRGDEFFFTEHVVEGEMVLPGTVTIEMARAAGVLGGERRVAALKDMCWQRPILPGQSREINVSLYPEAIGVEFEINSTPDSEQRLIYAGGKLYYEDEWTPGQLGEELALAEIKRLCPVRRHGEEHYQRFQRAGLEYGPGFRVIEELWLGDEQVLALLALSPHYQEELEGMALNPLLLDGVFQAAAAMARGPDSPEAVLYLPFSVESIEFGEIPRGPLLAYARRAKAPAAGRGGTAKYDAMLLDEHGYVVLGITGLVARSVRQDREHIA